MNTKEAAVRKYIEQCEIEVPDAMVENELQYITLEMKHRMQYDTLTSGQLHLNPGAELAEQEKELREAARYEAKSELVLKAVIAKQGFTVSPEELEAEAAAMAQRQNATVEQLKLFFGEELAMLERDVKERKAVDWIYQQTLNRYTEEISK